MERQPCPFRLFDDVGVAYSLGLVLGTRFFYEGVKNSLRGERLKGGLRNLSLRAPMNGGNFAMWGLCFSTFDCIITKIRKKEDTWNAVGGGFFTGCVLSWRGGVKIAIRNGIGGAIVLGMLESVMLAAGRAQTNMALKKEQVPKPPVYGSPSLTLGQRLREFNFIPQVLYKEDLEESDDM